MEIIKNIWRERYTYAKYIALAASLLSAVGLITMFSFGPNGFGVAMLGLGVLLSCCAYCLGGLWTAVKSALKIAGWGWLIAPIPYSIVTGLLTLLFALVAFFILPIIPVSRAQREHDAGRVY